MDNFEMNQRVGNLKSSKVGKIFSPYIKANAGDFKGFVILTDSYGYEIWQKEDCIILPLETAATEIGV
jgi:hypothetical protein